MNRCLILDLDHTLLHSVNRDKDKISQPNFSYKDYNIYLRPQLEKFLEYCFNSVPYIIIWSAGTEDYVNFCVANLPGKYQYYRIIHRNTYETVRKDVSLILTDPRLNECSFVFVDDTPDRITGISQENILTIDRFNYDNKETDYLLNIMMMIELLFEFN